MTNFLNIALVLTLMALGSVSASAQILGTDTLLYITDTNGRVGYFDLNTQKVTILGDSGVVLHALGFTATGQLYGDTVNTLYSINMTNGLATSLGAFSGMGSGANPSAVGQPVTVSQLWAVNVLPYTISALSGTLQSTNGNGTYGGSLYDILTDGSLNKVTLSGTTLTQNYIGNTGNTTIFGMATEANGTVLAISGTEIYTVNTTTAVLTPYENYSGQGLGNVAGSAIFVPEAVVPEPSSVALLLAGVAGLVFYQTRRRLSSKS